MYEQSTHSLVNVDRYFSCVWQPYWQVRFFVCQIDVNECISFHLHISRHSIQLSLLHYFESKRKKKRCFPHTLTNHFYFAIHMHHNYSILIRIFHTIHLHSIYLFTESVHCSLRLSNFLWQNLFRLLNVGCEKCVVKFKLHLYSASWNIIFFSFLVFENWRSFG